MNVSKILSENTYLKPLLEKAIKDRKEVIRLNKLVHGAGLLIIIIIVLGIFFAVYSTVAALSFAANFDAQTFESNKWYSYLTGGIIKHGYKFFYGSLIVSYLINAFYSKPHSKKLREFQELEEASLTRIMQVAYTNYEYQSTRFADTYHTFELSKIFGWKGKQITSYKIYGSLKKKSALIKTEIYDIGVSIYNKPLSFINYIPYINILFYYTGHTRRLLKNIFSSSTPEANLNDFRGLYAVSEFNKKLNGYTVVLPKSIESRLQHWDVNEQEKVELEDVRFTDHFLVYSTDQVEARYAISTAMMEKIVAFKEKAQLPIMLAFVENAIHIAIKNKDGIFSIPTAKQEAIEVLEEITQEVEVALNIVDDFSLNRKIFT
ncbi:MAG: DUF3137 domain-containing protein [Gilvibacter sp.]